MLPTPASLVADMHLATVVTSGIPCSFGQKLALPRHLSGKRLVDRADHLCTCKAWGQGTFIETASWIPSYTSSYVRADVPAGSQRKYSCKPISPVQVLSALSLSHTAPIQPIGLRLWRIDGDGRCLFRALAQGTHQLDKGQPLKLAEEEQAADALRQCICNKMQSKQEDISPFLEVPFEQYIDSMSQPSTWGGEPELSVAPDCLLRPVDVYMNGATGLQIMSSYTSKSCGEKYSVKVLFNGIGHYDLLIENSQVSKL